LLRRPKRKYFSNTVGLWAESVWLRGSVAARSLIKIPNYFNGLMFPFIAITFLLARSSNVHRVRPRQNF
jgi:hypothetical protein